MKIILAIDSFKGCLTSEEIEETFYDKLISKGHEVTSVPMSDGGEGMLEAFIKALEGNKEKVIVHDPLMRKVKAEYGITKSGTAIIETAKACGITLIKPKERNPLKATTYGVGEMIADAIKKGCREFIVGLGGSATCDTGTGMLKSLAEQFTNTGNIYELKNNRIIQECRFILASDVRNPLYGINGAFHVFGPQKGATEEMIEYLDKKAMAFAETSMIIMEKDMSAAPGAGAAGGLGYTFLQFLNANFQSGADLLLDLVDFDKVIAEADLIITGEGRADKQTLMGKLPERVLNRAKMHNIPVWLVTGKSSNKEELRSAGFEKVEDITPEEMDLTEAIKPQKAKENIIKWIAGQTVL